MKTSLLDLHDKVSTLTSMLDTFMKEMKGMVVEDVVVEEEVDKGNAAEPQEDAVMEEVKEKAREQEAVGEEKQEDNKEDEENPDVVDATLIQTMQPTIEETTSPGKPKPSKQKEDQVQEVILFVFG